MPSQNLDNPVIVNMNSYIRYSVITAGDYYNASVIDVIL